MNQFFFVAVQPKLQKIGLLNEILFQLFLSHWYCYIQLGIKSIENN